MKEIVWNKSIQPENKAEIEKYLTPFLFLLPEWCQALYIELYPNSENGNACETESQYDYRTIKVYFYAGWLNERPEAKRMHIVHELLHGFLAVLADYAANTFDALAPEEEDAKLNKVIRQELRLRHESVTQDLAYAILQKFSEVKQDAA